MKKEFPLSFAIDNLPVLPAVVGRISQVVSDTSSSADDVVEALKLDPVISGKVLKLANSAFVGIPRTISSIKNAVVLLGQKRIHSMVLATSVLTTFKENPTLPFSLFRYWKHSITVAIIAESIAKHLKRYNSIDAEDVFSAGLLHDIGKLVLAGAASAAFLKSLDDSQKKNIPFSEAEDPQESHTGLGSKLCDHWNLPSTLNAAVAFHHDPVNTPTSRQLVSIVHLSDIMSHIVGFSTFDHEMIPKVADCAITDVMLPPERLRVIADESLQNEKKIESFVNFLL